MLELIPTLESVTAANGQAAIVIGSSADMTSLKVALKPKTEWPWLNRSSAILMKRTDSTLVKWSGLFAQALAAKLPALVVDATQIDLFDNDRSLWVSEWLTFSERFPGTLILVTGDETIAKRTGMPIYLYSQGELSEGIGPITLVARHFATTQLTQTANRELTGTDFVEL